MNDDDFEVPLWLMLQMVSGFFAYSISLLILGAGFWKTLAVTLIVCTAMAVDFCRKYVVGVGGLLVTVVLLQWLGVNGATLADWSRVFVR